MPRKSTVVPLESEIEKYLVNKIKRAGGWAIKFQSEGHAGVPDRIVFWPDDESIEFVEVKRPGGKLRPLQVNMCKKISMTTNVYVVDCKQAADSYIRGRLSARFIRGRDMEEEE